MWTRSSFLVVTPLPPMATRVRLYYGAADTSIALATGSIRGMLEWLDEHS